MRSTLRRVASDVVDLWLPPSCAVCGAATAVVCGRCLAPLMPAEGLLAPEGVDEVAALLRYDESSRPIVAAFKFGGRRDVGRSFGPVMARLLDGFRPWPEAPTVTWAPTTSRRRRARGFDQAEVLARSVAGAARLPVRRVLHRRGGSSQTGRTRPERLGAVEFEATVPPPPDVVICDDVLTTGATMAAAGAALRGAGATRITGLVLASTPLW